MTASIEKLLLDLNIIHSAHIKEYFPCTRDTKDLKVYRCDKSGVIYLKDADHVLGNYYEHHSSKTYLKYLEAKNFESISKKTLKDDERRIKHLEEIIPNKEWLDVGAGFGGVLQLGKRHTETISAVEPQSEAASFLNSQGFKVYKRLEEIEMMDHYDIITLFHVFEHMNSPLSDLELINNLLKKGGKIVIEVPHALDILIGFFDLEAFKRFTFWSEHLILHTRESLRTFLRAAGFKNIAIAGVQRYPISNHLHWLAKEKPGGHEKWFLLNSDELNTAYNNLLNRLDMTDTLLAVAEK
jgi:SAM-dependent methyltransferase